jgi:hypothetical protein
MEEMNLAMTFVIYFLIPLFILGAITAGIGLILEWLTSTSGPEEDGW